MSDRLGQDPNLGSGWTADPGRAGVQHKAIFSSRPIYQAAGARRAPALEAQNAPGDVYTATYGDNQHAVGVLCAGVPDSALGGLVAHDVGSALRDWLWSRRTNPPTEAEWSTTLTGLQAAVEARLSSMMGNSNVTPLSRRGQQLGSETAVGGYLLALDGTVTFYLLGSLRVQVYAVDLTVPPAVYAGDPNAAWSSRGGLLGDPTWRREGPVQGISLAVADLPTQWGNDYRPLYEPGLFTATAGAMPATTSVAYVVAMIDPRIGPVTHSAAPQPFVAGMPSDATRQTQAIPQMGGGASAFADAAPTRSPAMPPPAPPRTPAFPSRSESMSRPTDDTYDDMSGLDSMSDDEVLTQESALRWSGPQADRDSGEQFTPAVGTDDRPRVLKPPPPAASPLAMLSSLPPAVRLGGAALLALLGLVVLFLLVSNLLKTQPPVAGRGTAVPATPVMGTSHQFTETNHLVSGRFYEIWQKEGQLAVFGFPISDQHAENNLQVQDFQRFRMEIHPDAQKPYDVQFANLGVQLYNALKLNYAPATKRPDPDGCLWFDNTKHNLCGAFRIYWTTHGRDLGAEKNPAKRSIALFGYPISDEVKEKAGDGKEHIVQWFERARFEFYPDNPGAYLVQMTLLNAELKKVQGR